jgi:hypothetical protein
LRSDIIRRKVYEMKLWKVATLVILATVPLLLLGRKRIPERGLQPEAGDSTNIFEHELSAD